MIAGRTATVSIIDDQPTDNRKQEPAQ
jgi:hypothetical protein